MIHPDKITVESFETIISATRDGDYDRFRSVGDDGFREGITDEAFQSVSVGIAPRLRAGFTARYLGHLHQQGAQVSLWKLAFLDGGDDELVRMSIFEGRVDGVLITPAFVSECDTA